jgi:hypothetical protein
VAFGDYEAVDNRYQRITDEALSLTNGSWTVAEVPLPTDDPGGQAVQVRISCQPTFCAAVSPYETDGQGLSSVVFSDAGGSWTETELPTVPNAHYGQDGGDNGAGAISCTQDGSCTAVGYYLIADFDGAYTGASITQLPANTPEAPFAVMLPLAGLCTVGLAVRRNRRGRRIKTTEGVSL